MSPSLSASVLPNLSPEVVTVSLVLLSAVLHASWNALAKSSGDQLANIAIVTATGGTLSLFFLPRVPFPDAETGTWLFASSVTHYAYHLALVRMYRLGDLSQVYPIARGLAPLGVAFLAAVWAGEALTPFQLAGLALASVAIISLSGVAARRASPRTGQGAVGTAVFVAALIGTYTFIDGRGVRSVAEPGSYIAWSFFVDSVPIVLTLFYLRGRKTGAALRSAGWRAVGGGLMGTTGYVIVLWAMSRTTMASVASLRESSVLFAAIIGTQILREPFGRRRMWASAALVIGLALVQIAGT